ncbi:hypothetical protein [Chlamydia felis]|uniref:hypothetical protein n=1 Tax=Chlamydia felis TaxID=83556 RepID=UPI000319FBBA|nr:hypothetical protein [Chlamydia felis]
MVAPTSENTLNITPEQRGVCKFTPSTKLIRITSVVLIILAVLAVVGSCSALILTTNIWFLLLSAVGGLCLSLGIIVNFIGPVKKEVEQLEKS